MREIPYNEAAPLLIDRLAHGGVFLNTPGNTMTIGWGSIGVYWGRPVFVALVRPQRDTYPRIQEAGQFTVSIPLGDDLKKELAFAGTQSGRDVNKFEGHGLTAVPAQKVACPIVQECALHIECVTRYAQTLDGVGMDAKILNHAYPEQDFHTLFYGEIVACYRTDL